MSSVTFGQLVKISYTGCQDTPKGGKKHFAKVEVSDGDSDDRETVEASNNVEKEPHSIKYSIQNIEPNVDAKKGTSEAFKEIMAKLQANKNKPTN